MRMSAEAQAWLTQTVQRVLAQHHLGEPERAGVHYELMGHLHAAGEAKAAQGGREEVSLGDLQAALLEMGGEAALAQAFVAPRAKPVPRAGVAVRAAAVVVDYLIVFLGMMATMFILFFMSLFFWPFSGFRGDPFHWMGLHEPEVLFPLLWLLSVGYFAFFEGRDGRTFGKQVFNLRVQRANGAPVTYREALIRNAVKLFPPLLFIDTVFMLLFFNHEKQRVSDRLADTVVVETR